MPANLGEPNLMLPPAVRQRFADLGAQRQTIESAARAYAREVQEAVRALFGASAQFEEGWQCLCQQALSGRTAEAQAERNRFLAEFDDWLRLLEEARDLVQFAEQGAQANFPEAEQLEKEAVALGRALKKLSARWQTAEDLEDLAAESLAPSAEQLEAVRRAHGYPQTWYDDDSKPF